jgi:hypothetical protein
MSSNRFTVKTCQQQHSEQQTSKQTETGQ